MDYSMHFYPVSVISFQGRVRPLCPGGAAHAQQTSRTVSRSVNPVRVTISAKFGDDQSGARQQFIHVPHRLSALLVCNRQWLLSGGLSRPFLF